MLEEVVTARETGL